MFCFTCFFFFFFFQEFSVLSDKLLLAVLARVERAKDLSGLALVSKAFYVFSRHDKLWRRLCFRAHRGNFRFKRSWRHTTLLQPESDPSPEEYPAELRVPELGSLLLYRRWYIANCDKKAFDISVSHIEKVAGMSVADFEEKYLKIGRPVVLTDAMGDWTAKEWTVEKILEKYGDCRFRLNWGEWDDAKDKYKRIYMTMRDFWRYCRQQHDTEPGYIFDGAFWKNDRVPGMLQEFNRTKYFTEDLFSVLGEHRPDFRWFLCGPAGSGSPWHTDPHATSAWNGLLHGSENFFLFFSFIFLSLICFGKGNDGACILLLLILLVLSTWVGNIMRQSRFAGTLKCILI